MSSLPGRRLPLVSGHQIVGETDGGRRLGVPWLGWTCGVCRFYATGGENLCDLAPFTGYDLDGGYAEWTVADERFAFSLPGGFGDPDVAPARCAGLAPATSGMRWFSSGKGAALRESCNADPRRD